MKQYYENVRGPVHDQFHGNSVGVDVSDPFVKLNRSQMETLVELQRMFHPEGVNFDSDQMIPPADGIVYKDEVRRTLNSAVSGIMDQFNNSMNVFEQAKALEYMKRPNGLIDRMLQLDGIVTRLSGSDTLVSPLNPQGYSTDGHYPKESYFLDVLETTHKHCKNEFKEWVRRGMSDRRRLTDLFRGRFKPVFKLPDAEFLKSNAIARDLVRGRRFDKMTELGFSSFYCANHPDSKEVPSVNVHKELKHYSYRPKPADTSKVELGPHSKEFVKVFAAIMHDNYFKNRYLEIENGAETRPIVMERAKQMASERGITGEDAYLDFMDNAVLEIGKEKYPGLTVWSELPEEMKQASISQAEETVKLLQMKGYDIEGALNMSSSLSEEQRQAIVDAVAENAHEVWARDKMAVGWAYGEKRDNENLIHPMLIPYEDVPESEKEYDREVGRCFLTSLDRVNDWVNRALGHPTKEGLERFFDDLFNGNDRDVFIADVKDRYLSFIDRKKNDLRIYGIGPENSEKAHAVEENKDVPVKTEKDRPLDRCEFFTVSQEDAKRSDTRFADGIEVGIKDGHPCVKINDNQYHQIPKDGLVIVRDPRFGDQAWNWSAFSKRFEVNPDGSVSRVARKREEKAARKPKAKAGPRI